MNEDEGTDRKGTRILSWTAVDVGAGTVFVCPCPFLLERKEPIVMQGDRLNRRRFLSSTAAAVAASAVATGCQRGSESPQPASPANTAGRDDLPLRVLLCGQSHAADAIATAWGGISQQPLQLTVMDPTEQDAETLVTGAARSGLTSSLAAEIQTGMKRCDVAIVPAYLIADLDEAELLVPLADDLLSSEQLDLGQWFPVLRESLMPWGGRPVAVPLGCLQPAQFVSANHHAGDSTAGSTALPRIPTAGGAAAKLFLWLANQANPPVWLFDRNTMEPVIDGEIYQQTLAAMRQSLQTTALDPLLPSDIWQQIATDDFSQAIGWPAVSGDPPRVAPLPDVSVSAELSLTGDSESASVQAIHSLLPDCEAPLGLISVSCRQSAAAKRFLSWLAAGEGRQMVRAANAGFTPLKSNDVQDGNAGLDSPYDRFLRQRLTCVSLRPALRIHAADRYLATLDQSLLTCLQGDQSAGDALAAATAQWQQLTADIGVKRQAKAWRMSQGLRN